MISGSFSYWERTAFIDNADVIVIGSGLVGLSAALHLKQMQPSVNVLVLERGFLPTGASTKNAGFACFGTVSEQLEALKHSTAGEVLRLADYRWRGLQRLRQNLGDEAIDYRQHGGFELFMSSEKAEAENAIGRIGELNTLFQQVTGSKQTYSVADARINDFGFKNVSRMIFNSFEGQIHTGKMMRRLLQKAYDMGILVLNGCSIESLSHGANQVILNTSRGPFQARRVILATNAFASQLFPNLSVIPGRGQVLVTKPIPGLKLKGTYHFDKGYYYFRNIDGRVLFGGGRNLDFAAEETAEFGQTEMVRKKLTTCLKEVILPGHAFEIDYWWSGIMGFGEEISPIVKEVEPGIFCAVRCNGMGIAMGSVVGEEVAGLVLESL